MTFPKPCKDCGESFQPTGRNSKFCDKCREKSNGRVYGTYSQKVLRVKKKMEDLYDRGYDKAISDILKMVNGLK